ncbi:Fic family protein [Leucobacter komagatae]|uniref:Fic family protein n=1 Tax=Leucobacter komagatae TaxID=55969 RepID=UPI0014769997|nr:Fic family protein [Leucobacter komagatae]
MTVKHSAPTSQEVQKRIRLADESRLLEVLLGPRIDDTHYHHWEQLQHRRPPAGMNHDEWWMSLKLQRLNVRRDLPFADKSGQPFWFAYNDEVLRLSEEIARRTGGLTSSGTGQSDRSNRRYLLQSLLEEAITSSQLEGASTSRKHAKRMIEAGVRPATISDQMIVNNFLAMQDVKANAANPLTAAFVLELHATLTANTLADSHEVGRLQSPSDERVSVVDQQERVTHAPPPAETLPDRLALTCDFANGTVDEVPYLSPVIRAIVTHFMFGYDHYFSDGNGRTARAAFYWAMLHNGYHLAEHVAISRVLREAPAQYAMAYEYSEDDEGDITYFILHQLRAFKRALEDFEEYVRSKVDQGLQMRETLRASAGLLNERQVALLEWIAREEIPRLVAKEVAHRFNVTEQTARNDLKGLNKLGLVQPSSGRRPTVWAVPKDLSARLDALGD